MKKLFLALALALSVPAFASEWFGYYHVWHYDIPKISDHTNMLIIQSANPNQNLAVILRDHPKAPFFLEWSSFSMHRANGYQKVWTYDPNKTKAILDTLEVVLKPYIHRLAGFIVGDEIETNEESVLTVESIIKDIRQREMFANTPTWLNYDNIFQHHSGAPLVIPKGVNIISLTPSYGQSCNFGSCDGGRYNHLLNTAKLYNDKNPGSPVQLVVIGDGWSPNKNSDAIHLSKSEALFYEAREIARLKGIKTIGQAVFSFSEPQNSVKDSTVMKEEWKRIGLKFITGQLEPSLPPTEPTPTPNPTPPPCRMPDQAKEPELPRMPEIPKFKLPPGLGL